MSCSKPIQALSFAEIIKGRDATVRVTGDSMLYLVDLVMVAHGSSRTYASQVIHRIPDSDFDSNKIIERQLGGKGGHRTKLLSFKDAAEFIMVLPGEFAKGLRKQFADIITRYAAGDKSLHNEIDANAASDSPIAQMARASMAAPNEDEAFMVGFKRRRMELELSRMEHENNALIVDTRVKEQGRILAACAELERINDPSRTNLDTRTRLMIQDAMQSSLLVYQAAPTQSQQGPSPNTPLSIGNVANELGYTLTGEDLRRVGVAVKKRYDQQDNTEPLSKHLEMCSGRPTYVNSYSEKYRGMIAEVIQADQEKALKSKQCKPLETYFKSS